MAKAKKLTLNDVIDIVNAEDNAQVQSHAVIEETPALLVNTSGNLVDTNNVLRSASLVKNNITYPSPEVLLRPVIDILGSAVEIRCNGENEIEIAHGENNYKAFERFNVIAKFPVDDEIFYEVGCLVALDLTVPKIKVYSGAVVNACLNLTIYGHDTCVKFDLNSNNAVDTVKSCLQDIAVKIEKTKEIIARLKLVHLTESITKRFVGALSIGNASERSAYGANFLSQGVALISEESSKYYYKQTNFNAWLLYNAFTENIKKANIFDVADKSRDFYKLIANNTDLMQD